MSATFPIIEPRELHEAEEDEVVGFCAICDGLLLDGDDYDIATVAPIPYEGGEEEMLICGNCIARSRQQCC